ncbi:pseudouridine synthase [Limtongia smithiae]|uniref:pseudouridine synthase n=1 Tax=Limtongia smithiae TaxID=1125753 RepID=UPI0034CE856C
MPEVMGAELLVPRSNRGSYMDKSDYKFWTKKDLIARIAELEKLAGTTVAQTAVTPTLKPPRREKEFDFSAHPTRLIGLRFAYLGWNYNGLNVQFEDTPLPTVEGMLLKALARCRLIENENDVKSCAFSRCGRTDKGVSALAQVVSLRVRSRLSLEEQSDSVNDAREYAYISLLNNSLPPDIRVYAVCLHPPPNFDARHSCRARHYKYFFARRQSEKHQRLDIDAMREAVGFLVGTHDFRNFCKIDGSKQITHFFRQILSADITLIDADAEGDEEIYVFDLRGTAFLWHQVRCIMGALFLIGQNLESPSLIAHLLDVTLFPQRPVYDMAADFPLVLYNCEYDADVIWHSAASLTPGSNTSTALSTLRGDAYGLWYDGAIKNQVTRAMRDAIENAVPAAAVVVGSDRNAGRVKVNTGDGLGRWRSVYEPVEQRRCAEHFEVQNERYLRRKQPVALVAKED